MDDQDTPKNIAADRGIPSVANQDNKTLLFGGTLIVVAALAMIAIVMNDTKEAKPALLTDPQEAEFKNTSNAAAPYIEPTYLQPIEAKRPEFQPIDPNEIAMQREALRLALEERKRMEQRQRSPQMVLDQSTNQAPSEAHANPTGSSGGASLLSGSNSGDANLNFANQYSNEGVETVTATQMQNLHALIPQGTMISGILETAIQSDLPGMVRAIISDNVYSFDGSHLLVPKGSKLVGRYRSAVVNGQSRVFVIWTRLIRHDGVSINIGSIGTDALGRSGLPGQVDTHFFERFGSSLLLSLIDASIEIGVEAVDNADSATVALESGNDFSRSAEIALENSIAIPPTIHIDQGVRIKVFTGKDLDFSQVSGNLQRGR